MLECLLKCMVDNGFAEIRLCHSSRLQTRDGRSIDIGTEEDDRDGLLSADGLSGFDPVHFTPQMNIHQNDMRAESHRTLDSFGPGRYSADDRIPKSGQSPVEIESDERLIFHDKNPGCRWHLETRFQTLMAS
jgi:hypothetical protein